jgi:hypothetical protein
VYCRAVGYLFGIGVAVFGFGGAANDLSLRQLARCTTKSPELLMSFSNHARTPLGIFLTMNLLGLNMVLLV